MCQSQEKDTSLELQKKGNIKNINDIYVILVILL
jgi:hypothetical protein